MQFWLGPLLGAAGAAILYKYVFRHPEAAAAEAAVAKAEADATAAKAVAESEAEPAQPVRPAAAVLSPAVRRSTTSVGTASAAAPAFQGVSVSVEAAPAPLLPVADSSEWR